MAARVEKIFTSLDIGSSKISAMIAGRMDNGELTVLGTGQRASKGVRRGYIADTETTEMDVRDAVEQAERIAGTNIDDVWVSFSAGGLQSMLTSVETELGGHRIEQEDIDLLLDAGRSSIDPKGKMVLHAQPALYTLDGLNGVKKPKGLHADRLGVDIHVILAEASPVRNIEMSVRGAHLNVKSIVASPIAAGTACLSKEERELGVALVEMGAEVTNVSLFAGGMLVGLTTLPYGAADITDDIASSFGLRRAQAERIKCFYGSATTSPRDNHDVINLDLDKVADGAEQESRITRAQLIAVIRQRLDHLIGEIGRSLKDLGFTGPVGRQVVLTGGGAELKGIADYAQSALGRTVRVGRPTGLSALPEAHSGPAFAGLAGLALYASQEPVDLRYMSRSHQNVHKYGGSAVIGRLMSAIRGNF
ncbi:MAG: cell division protein FtsA [Sphingomonadales bacterium]|nr:cell division protein FtsA [Sphingomonadales bacterium]PIX66547.1 MAG: cell division protein FtsA [Sphingomonadales bacterium CG_4_10_14_3_um_filter_58_15]NCO47810.1 cell division protein FtsA [Sphingomonadales bacterium]NCP01084.1 cell division protein FtsA [Sphingomonadales bacterium]NCP27485.1 cell division protein FtsA [Sphingomonadales bacterium]